MEQGLRGTTPTPPCGTQVAVTTVAAAATRTNASASLCPLPRRHGEQLGPLSRRGSAVPQSELSVKIRLVSEEQRGGSQE